MISVGTVEFGYCCYYNTSELGKTLSYKGLRQLRLISFQWTSEFDAGLWISDLDFHCKVFAFYIFTFSEFLTKDVLECIINPTYLIGCCYNTLINVVLKIMVLIFNTTHKIGCCEYCYQLGWHNIWRVKSGPLNCPFIFIYSSSW